MGILDKIKNEAAQVGGARGNFFFVKDGDKARVRFLQDIDDGLEIVFHDSYKMNINVPCQRVFGRSCSYCDSQELRTRSMYAWSIYNYDFDDVQILMYAVNQCTPIGQLIAIYEQYSTITDRDFVISCTGKHQNKAFSVLPLDKMAFRNAKIHPFSREAMLKYIDEAYPLRLQNPQSNAAFTVANSYGNSNTNSNSGGDMLVPFEQEKAPGGNNIEEAKVLYKQCKEKGLYVEPRKTAEYYRKQLEDFEKQSNDWNSSFEVDW